jgi:hypothetical protein
MAAPVAGGAMVGVQALSALSGAFSAWSQAQTAKTGYWLQEQTMRRNQQAAGWAAQDALDRGEVAQSNQRKRTKQLQGTQRAMMGASGIDMTQGSALRILTDTDYMGAQDEATIRHNAANEAAGYRMQGAGLGAQADMAAFQNSSISPGVSAAASLMTGAGQVADMWYRYNKPVG